MVIVHSPSRSSPWSWFWWCSLHWRLCWCCPSCRYPQDDHCGWRVSRVNGKYMKSRYHRQEKLVQGIGSQLQGQLFRLDDSLDVGSPTRLGCFCLTRPVFTTHVPKLILPGAGFTWGKPAGRCSLEQLASMLPFLSLLWWHLFGLGSMGLWWKSVWRLWEPQDLRHFIFSPGLWEWNSISDWIIKSLMKVG